MTELLHNRGSIVLGCASGAPSGAPQEWDSIIWSSLERNVLRLQARIVKAQQQCADRALSGRFNWLEPCAGKLARTVLRGRARGNPRPLPGGILQDTNSLRFLSGHPNTSRFYGRPTHPGSYGHSR